MLLNDRQLNVSSLQALASKLAFTTSEESQATKLTHVYQQLLVLSCEAQYITSVIFFMLFDEINTFFRSGGSFQKLTTL